MKAFAQHLEHRKDIEGLRALAILLVVAAHAGVPGFAGGFVGVDVFFVLSGYLITGLLVLETQRTGKVDFAAFYTRRFKRLLPALLLMLAVVSVLAMLLMSAHQQVASSVAASMAAMWASNLHFASASLDYFALDAEKNLFLHTWSLGVEEQFYLLWPILLMLVLRCSTPVSRSSGRGLQWAMVLIMVLSFSASLAWTHSAPQWAFYLMPSRAWQFAIGAMVFLRANTMGSMRISVRQWCGWLGLSSIFVCMLLIRHGVAYPGAWALLPTLGTAAVLASGAESSVGRFLSIRPLQALGRVSYSWYLWHWPVLVLGAALMLDSAAHRLAAVCLSLLLAAVSFWCIENPLRKRDWFAAGTPRVTLLFSVMLMTMAFALARCWHDSAVAQSIESAQAHYRKARMDLPEIYRDGCDDWYRDAKVEVCAYGNKDARHTAVLIGDSVGLQWFPAVSALLEGSDWRLLVLTKSACPMVDESFFYERIGRDYVECSRWRSDAIAHVVSIAPDVVLLGSADGYPFSQAQWRDGSTRILRPLSEVAGRVYIIRSTPALPFDGPECLTPKRWAADHAATSRRCVASVDGAHGESVYQSLRSAARSFPNVSFVDVNDMVCPDAVCSAERDGYIVFRDTQHVSARFAASLADEFGRQLALGSKQSSPSSVSADVE